MAQVQLQDDDRTYTPPDIGPVVGETRVKVSEPYGGPLPTGYSQAEVQDFLNRNPGDEHRIFEALTPKQSSANARGTGPLFDDPASAQLQGIAQAQMGEVRSNPGLDALMKFLNSQFTQLSTNPGYSPEDLAILNTQAFEPIEARRKADQQRVLERTAARGFLPSSGLTENESQQADTEANRQRTVAGRDLAINAIGQRRSDLDKALQLGSLLGLDIPRSQRSEELALARVPYQMGRDSLADLLAVINGSPSSGDLFSQTLQANQQSLLNQQQNDRRNEALMEQIGTILGTLFR